MKQPLPIALIAQRKAGIAASIAAALAALAGVGLLAISGWFLTGAALAGAGGVVAVQAFNYLLPSAGIRGLAIMRTLARYFERLLGHRDALRGLADLRPRLFARLASADMAEMAQRGGGVVAAHLGSDVEALEDLAIRRVSAVSAITGALAGLGAALLAGVAPAAILGAGLAISMIATRWAAPRLLAQPWRDHGEALERLKGLYGEYAGASVELALFGQTSRVATLLAEQAAALDRARLAIVRAEGLLQTLQLTIASVTVAAMLGTSSATLPLQALAALAGAGAFEALGGLGHSFLQRARVDAALARLEAIARLPERPNRHVSLPPQPAITLGSGADTLNLPAGGRVRITGPSGSGKTRLAMTLAGLRRDAPEPALVGGVSATSLAIEALRLIFAVSAQDAPLLAGTVADNLRLARPGLSEAEMWSALEIACLADTVRAMPAALETWLGPDGARLSGGQRKRLSLARALLAQRPWLVLDEPSEGLDLQTEKRMAQALDTWLRDTGTGLVLVNHRPGLDWLAQQVYAVNDTQLR
ncbi:ATP-binding cassette domain-containing protein [Novosphingobium sp. ERN07]|uniref:amino acid ABC transporter ATP-binding/permease protein n=1 Tax=Novosphingobium sp. ERN07 TaxID=2726187 RepID=UPI0014565CC2|nr:ATP-binding cassette domain-containing protein [Novosphingobium sp. ERN07]NLR71386.1 ATP-binding cassette domain-containing protein [Novosphingobium sp. ERN07]